MSEHDNDTDETEVEETSKKEVDPETLARVKELLKKDSGATITDIVAGKPAIDARFQTLIGIVNFCFNDRDEHTPERRRRADHVVDLLEEALGCEDEFDLQEEMKAPSESSDDYESEDDKKKALEAFRKRVVHLSLDKQEAKDFYDVCNDALSWKDKKTGLAYFDGLNRRRIQALMDQVEPLREPKNKKKK